MKSCIPSLAVDDVDTTLRFYTEVLGFETTWTLPGPDGRTVHGAVKRGGSDLMFGLYDPTDGPREARGAGLTLYFTVGDDEDLDAYFARAKAAGAVVLQEPTDQFWGHRDWTVADPDGYRLAISKEVGEMDLSKMPGMEGARAEEPALVPAD